MNPLQAFILGIVQGLTEFIPVSSTAHLLVAQHLFGIPAENPALFAFNVLVQLGTILSLIIYFWKDLLAIIVDTLKNLGGVGKFNSLPENAKMGWYIVIATIPALLAGVLLKKYVEILFTIPLVEAAIRLFAAAILLTLAETFGKRNRRLAAMTWLDALFVGVMQVIAVFPGASRSGTTISAGMFRGFDRPSAARFAFLMSVPVMLAAGAYETLGLIKDHTAGLASYLPLIGIGFITAAVVGWLAIRWLLNFLNTKSLYIFAVYCAVAGLVCVALQLLG
jgi:undecaprenyl-diphosphatase